MTWSKQKNHRAQFEAPIEEYPGERRGKEEEKRGPEDDECWEESDPDDEFMETFDAPDADEPPSKLPPKSERPKDDGEMEDDDEDEEPPPPPAEEEKAPPAEDKPEYEIDMEDVERPGWLIPHFTVLKYDPRAKSTSKHKRVWAIDMCRKLHMNMDTKGQVKKTHHAMKLLCIEKNIMKHNMAKLMFFDASHAYELVFQHGNDRERFYECSSAIRPFRTWCDDLCKPEVDNSRTVINTKGKVIKVDLDGKMQDKECEEETEVHASRIPHERLKLWTGTFNLDHKKPPQFETMKHWIPLDQYDMYAIAVQDATYREQDDEWYRYVSRYFGKAYMIIAQMSIWDCLLCVVARKRILSRVANVEGYTAGTKDHITVNNRGGCAISLRYHETSLCFIAMHLPDPVNMYKQRLSVLYEILDGIRIACTWTDLMQQFHHCFFMGCNNFQVEIPFEEAMDLIEDKNWPALLEKDQLADLREDEGILYGWQEMEINFPPTSYVTRGTTEYTKAEAKREVRTPSYTDRILWRNNPTCWYFEQLSYQSHPEVMTSSYLPVSSTFELDCQRPAITIFGHNVAHKKFVFDHVECELDLKMNKPLLQLYCWEVDGEKYTPNLKSTDKPRWEAGQIPEMPAMIHHPHMLETQFFILTLREGKTTKSQLRGSAIATVKESVQKMDELIPFESVIEYRSKKIGTMRGAFKCVFQ